MNVGEMGKNDDHKQNFMPIDEWDCNEIKYK